MTAPLEITIGVGVGPVVYGMSELAVRRALGEPADRWTCDHGDLHLGYRQRRLMLVFAKDDSGRLSLLEIGLEHVTLAGRPVAAKIADAATQFMEAGVEFLPPRGSESHSDLFLASLDASVALFFGATGEVSSVSLSPRLSDDGVVQWPE